MMRLEDFTKIIPLSSDMKNIKIKIVVSIYITDFYVSIENHIVETQILFYNDVGGIRNYLDKIIYKPHIYYKNIFYDNVINRLANILKKSYHKCQPESKSKSQSRSQVNNERFHYYQMMLYYQKLIYTKFLVLIKQPNSQQIRKPYRTLSLVCHPDKVPDDMKKKAETIFKKVNEAYTILSDPEQRSTYDSNYHDIIENEEAKEDSNIRIKRKIMEKEAAVERNEMIEAANRVKAAREALKKAVREAEEKAAREAEEEAAREAEEEAAREAEEEAAREAEEEAARAEEKAAREAIKKKLEKREKIKERRRARIKTVKDFLLPTRMFTRKKIYHKVKQKKHHMIFLHMLHNLLLHNLLLHNLLLHNLLLLTLLFLLSPSSPPPNRYQRRPNTSFVRVNL